MSRTRAPSVRRLAPLVTLAALGALGHVCVAAPLDGQQSGGVLRAPRTAAPARAAALRPGATGALGGSVFDSTAGAPLARAVVLLTHASRGDVAPLTIVTDTGGRFLARDLPSGRWIVTFLHRTADEYGVTPVPREVTVGDGDLSTVALALPGARAIRAMLCGSAIVGDSLGVLVGSVRDEETGRYVGGASVTVSWRVIDMRNGVRVSTRRVPVTTAADGTFRLCALPSEDALSVRAAGRGTVPGEALRSGELFIVVARSAVTRLEVGVGHVAAGAGLGPIDDSTGAPRGARLTGTSRLAGVVSDPQGRPKPDVRVFVHGTGQQMTTGPSGAFRFDSLPAGSWTVEARAIGLAPLRATVQLSPSTPASASLMFERWTPALDRVVVYGKPPAEQRFLEDFLERRDRGLGQFYTRDEIMKRGIVQLSQLLMTISSVRVRPNPRPGRSPMIEGRGACKAEVFVNGVRVPDGDSDVDALVRPQDILGLEVHDQVNGVPAAFGSVSNCLVVGVWTRR